MGSPAATPEEHEDGEAGFALLLPHIEGVRVRPFHFCKHTLNNRALEQAGTHICTITHIHVCTPFQKLPQAHPSRYTHMHNHTHTRVSTLPETASSCVFVFVSLGLLGNPDLKVVLLFGYMAFKSGASRFLNQFLEPLSHTNALIAGGHVERAFCPHRDWCVQDSQTNQ